MFISKPRCKIYGVSFGRVDADEARGFELPDRPILDMFYAGPFVDSEHSVAGDVYIRDSETLVIKDFSFDGRVSYSSIRLTQYEIEFGAWHQNSSTLLINLN